MLGLKQEMSASCPATQTKSRWSTTNYSMHGISPRNATRFSSANIDADQHMPQVGPKAYNGTSYEPLGISLYQASSQGGGQIPNLLNFHVSPPPAPLVRMVLDPATEDILHMVVRADLLRTQRAHSIRSAILQAQQLVNIPHAPFLQPRWPSQSPLSTSSFLPHAVSTLLYSAAAAPAPHPDALRLILAPATVAFTAPLARPPPQLLTSPSPREPFAGSARSVQQSEPAVSAGPHP